MPAASIEATQASGNVQKSKHKPRRSKEYELLMEYSGLHPVFHYQIRNPFTTFMIDLTHEFLAPAFISLHFLPTVEFQVSAPILFKNEICSFAPIFPPTTVMELANHH